MQQREKSSRKLTINACNSNMGFSVYTQNRISLMLVIDSLESREGWVAESGDPDGQVVASCFAVMPIKFNMFNKFEATITRFQSIC